MFHPRQQLEDAARMLSSKIWFWRLFKLPVRTWQICLLMFVKLCKCDLNHPPEQHVSSLNKQRFHNQSCGEALNSIFKTWECHLHQIMQKQRRRGYAHVHILLWWVLTHILMFWCFVCEMIIHYAYIGQSDICNLLCQESMLCNDYL